MPLGAFFVVATTELETGEVVKDRCCCRDVWARALTALLACLVRSMIDWLGWGVAGRIREGGREKTRRFKDRRIRQEDVDDANLETKGERRKDNPGIASILNNRTGQCQSSQACLERPFQSSLTIGDSTLGWNWGKGGEGGKWIDR